MTWMGTGTATGLGAVPRDSPPGRRQPPQMPGRGVPFAGEQLLLGAAATPLLSLNPAPLPEHGLCLPQCRGQRGPSQPG